MTKVNQQGERLLESIRALTHASKGSLGVPIRHGIHIAEFRIVAEEGACRIIAAAEDAAEALQSLLVENGLKDATIAQLREELQIAIDDHDSHFGRANFVGHWTNTARTLLGDSQP